MSEMPEENKKPEKPKEKETIRVNTEDFLALLKSVGELKEGMGILREDSETMKKQLSQPSTFPPQSKPEGLPQEGVDMGDDAFVCNESGNFKIGKNLEGVASWSKSLIGGFRPELEALMKKYQVSEVVARFLKRL